MKLIAASKNHPFGFAVMLLLCAFIFSHGPFFLWMALPAVLPDSFDYYNTADILLNHPISELGKQPLEIPLGYPLFLIFTGALSNKLLFIVALQSLLKLAASLYLAYTCCRYYHYGVLVSVALSIYIMNGFTIRWDTTIYSESIYSSSLIILSAVLISALNRGTLTWFWILGVWLFVPSFLRPNGIYVYFIIPVLFLYFFAHKQSMNKYVAIVIPALLLNLSWAAFNTKAYGVFVPGNFTRFTQSVNTATLFPAVPGESNQSASTRLKRYMNLNALPQFYYSIWPATYKTMYIEHQVTDTSYSMYDWSIPVSVELRKLVYKEYYNAPDRFVDTYRHLQAQAGLKGIWMKAYQLWYNFESLFLRNFLLFIVFAALAVYAGVKLVLSRFKNSIYLIISLLGGLHLIGIFVVALTHQSVQLRYTQVSEFIIYVTFALIPVMVLKSKPE